MSYTNEQDSENTTIQDLRGHYELATESGDIETAFAVQQVVSYMLGDTKAYLSWLGESVPVATEVEPRHDRMGGSFSQHELSGFDNWGFPVT